MRPKDKAAEGKCSSLFKGWTIGLIFFGGVEWKIRFISDQTSSVATGFIYHQFFDNHVHH